MGRLTGYIAWAAAPGGTWLAAGLNPAGGARRLGASVANQETEKRSCILSPAKASTQDGTAELFDRVNYPHEVRNLATTEPEVVQSLWRDFS